MADDDKKTDKKDAKGDPNAAAPVVPASSSKKALIGVIVGVAILAAVGMGVGKFVVNTLAPAKADAPVAGETADAHGKEGGKTDAAHVGDGILKGAVSMETVDLKCNITGTGGTRYATMTVGLWVPISELDKLKVFKRPIQDRLEGVLTTYQLDDFTSPTITERMKKDFASSVERLLDSIFPKSEVQTFIIMVDITNRLTQ